MKKYIFLLGALFLPGFVGARSYPVKQVSKPIAECKFTHWTKHSSDCKISVPRIYDADYNKYKDNRDMRLIYSVMWTATYTNGWDVGHGSHLGTDFATAQGTPVYAIGDGVVQVAGWKSGWGNTVVIRHKIESGFIRSVYAHLDKVHVGLGNVSEGTLIGEVGHTGNSWGNHLHFQIDINQKGFHPYYHNECDKTGISDIVNNGYCQEYVTANTIDGIYFLETNGAGIQLATTDEQRQEVSEQVRQKEKIDPDTIISRERIMLTELEKFLNKYNFKTYSKIDSNVMNVGDEGQIWIKMTDRRGNPFDGFPAEFIQVSFNDEIISASPEVIKYMPDGERVITVNAKKVGNSPLVIKIGGKIIQYYTIRVVDNNTTLKAENAFVRIAGTPYVGHESRGIVVMQDENRQNILSVPYEGSYTLKVQENAMLCPIWLSSVYEVSYVDNHWKCYADNLTTQINFDYSKSLRGILIYKIIPYQEGKIHLSVYKNNKVIGTHLPQYASLPKDLDQAKSYKPYVQKALRDFYARDMKHGYFGPDYKLRQTDAVYWIRSTFPHAKVPSNADKYQYMTRLEFMKLVSWMTGLSASDTSRHFADISTAHTPYANLLVDYDAKFLDNFGVKYFQPDKYITRAEAAYVLYMMNR